MGSSKQMTYNLAESGRSKERDGVDGGADRASRLVYFPLLGAEVFALRGEIKAASWLGLIRYPPKEIADAGN